MNISSILTAHIIIISCITAFSQPMRPQPADSSQAIADRIVQSQIPVLVDFWAPWCGPCRMLNPIIKELEEAYTGKILFIKVNVDIHKALATYFSVSSIPTVFLIYQKNVVQALPGVQTKETYQKVLDDIIKNPPKIAPPPADSTSIKTPAP